MNAEIILIEKVISGGDGLGRLPDGRVVMVPFVLPGERVRVQSVKERKSVVFAVVEDVLDPSPGRRTPPCPLFGECGGCRLQHADPLLQVEIKRGILEEIWRGQVPAAVGGGGGGEFGYRRRVRLHALPGNRGVGFMRARSNSVVPIRDCLLCHPEIRACLAWLAEGFLPRLNPRRWELQEIHLAVGDAPPVLVRPVFSRPPDRAALERALGPLPYPLALGDATDPQLSFSLGPFRYEAEAGAFFQANLAAAGAVLQDLGRTIPPGASVAELYCGMGLFTVLWASRGDCFVAVEGDPRLQGPFARTMRLNGMIPGGFVQHSAEAWLERQGGKLSDFAWLFADPPRTGFSESVRRSLARACPSRIAYLSCDPVTQRRDLTTLFPQAVPTLRFYDFFPNTAHLECLAVLAPPLAGGD